VLLLSCCTGPSETSVTSTDTVTTVPYSELKVSGPPQARAELELPDGREFGYAIFHAGPTGLIITIEHLNNFEFVTPGWHGLHLRSVGTCSDAADRRREGSAHGYLNPGGPEPGDLPNMHTNTTKSEVQVYTSLVSLTPGKTPNLLDDDGSALVVYAAADDHRTQPFGGAGEPIACGVIRPG
jgi:Cu-Zn family superoxide dismutase